ncbi:TonB-dependent siderophore receptor [uncultured Sphingomonas sp.]|uniref:TonB-dependent siderophore receptor n=1 Tax=uncultured Sphingomonas sp. TaxID=158754 RepID=UPI00262E50E6|nr:TonB-dependent siderophore receptor [uncultured Sphingomonas sp.]
MLHHTIKGNLLRIPVTIAAFSLATVPFIADAQEVVSAAPETEPDDADIVVLGTRAAPTDRTLSSDGVTDRMSPSSRSIERDLLTASGAHRLSDALELVSGVSNQNNRGGFLDNFAIRGFLGTPDGGAEYYVDGFLANRGMGPPRDPAIAERIEVLKGPSGALFGDIDPGGRVNIVSKTPRFVPRAEAIFTLGSFGTRRVEADVTGPLSSTLAARIVVAAEHSDGWRDFVTLDRTVVAPSLTWAPSDRVRITYVGEVTRFDAPFDRGIPAIAGDANAVPRHRFYGEPGDGLTRFRNTRHQVTGLIGLGGGWSVNAGAAYRTGTLAGFSSDHTILVQLDERVLRRQRRQRDYAVDDLSARAELAGEIGAHRVAIGLKGYHLAYRDKYLRVSPTAAAPYAIEVENPVYGQPKPTPRPFVDNRERRWAGTLYVQDMWSLGDRLTLLGGLRLDPYRQRLHNRLTGVTGVNKDAPVNGRFGGRFQLSEQVALHANWGESFLLNSGTDRRGNGFDPERGRGYEAGVTVRTARLDLGATWFDITKNGILTNDPTDPGFLAPVGTLTSRGVELDASLRLGERWQIVGNYAWTHARTDDATFATDRALNVPAHSGTLFAVGRFLDADARGASVSAGIGYVGRRAGAIDASGLVLPAYVKLKAAADYTLSATVSVRIEADNLLDERYAQSSYSPVWVYPGAPRSIRAVLRTRW